MTTNTDPIFILGYPRSGTKLLMNLINNNREVLLANEFESHIYILKKWYNKNISRNFDKIFNDLINTPYYLELDRINKINLSIKDFEDKINNYDLNEIIEVFIRITSYYDNPQKKSTTLYGQKSINLIRSPKEINFFYPDSKFIYIIRDVRNCSLSSFKAWKTNIFRFAQRWYDDITNLEKFLEDISHERKLMIKFEDLIDNSSNELKKICNFLNIKYSDNMNVLNKNVENLGDARGSKVIISQSNMKYLNFFNSNQIEKIESLTYVLLKKYGYEFRYDGDLKRVPNYKMFYFKILDFKNKILFNIKERGIINFFYILKIRILSQIKK
tara:strand:+ start:4328 stop:5311 length:984 start_codon:yes stop_codon:yes gene_type:complete